MEEFNQQFLPASEKYVTMEEVRALIANSMTSITSPLTVKSSYMQSEDFTTGSKGWQIKANGDVEFNNGYFRGDLTGATGTFSGTVNVGSLNIPDITTANSFHTDTAGNSWWGCNVADFALDNNNANAYILNTGVAKFQDVSIAGTVSGRSTIVLAQAIDASGHFADDAISTASASILGSFTFGASGALQIGTYSAGVTGDIRISPTGILGRDKNNATTFSIDATTGVAVLNGLVVGTNVGLGTAQDSSGVTTIVGNVVTTSFVNALSITAGSVACENLTGTYITGKTIRTSVSGKRVIMSSDILQVFDNSNNYERIRIDSGQIWLSQGNASFSVYQSGSIGFTSSGLVLENNELGGGTSLVLGDDNLYLSGNIYLNGSYFSPSNYLTTSTFSSHTGSVSAHHSSTSNGIAITPSSIVVSGNITPSSSNKRQCGTASYYWARVYSDAYFTKNTSFQTGWDKYDDLQIIRDLRTTKDDSISTGYKLDISSLPEEMKDGKFVDYGGLQSFNLCAMKKMVECIDDLKKTIDDLNNRIEVLEHK